MRQSKVRRTHAAAIVGVFVLTALANATGNASTPARFRDLFPAQQAARTDPSVPATNYWALLIGINDYAGSTKDNVGSYQDARELRKLLLARNWHSDHIVLLANRQATASMIIQSIRWLASKTNSASVVVFNYSGHEKPFHTSSDGDNEKRDIGLWASDNRFILDGKLGREMDKVRAKRMWINLAVCRAQGFSDHGMIKPGRVLTFSSPEKELSYEDPYAHYTVAGWFIIIQAMTRGYGDTNGDGVITVEEAFRYARPQVINRTSGKQHPVITDKQSGSFSIVAPAPPPPPPPPPARQCTLVICR
jgi:caspase domain-containing protein